MDIIVTDVCHTVTDKSHAHAFDRGNEIERFSKHPIKKVKICFNITGRPG